VIELGEILGMGAPGTMRDAYGTYCAPLLLSFLTSSLCLGCFVLMCATHPLEHATPEVESVAERVTESRATESVTESEVERVTERAVPMGPEADRVRIGGCAPRLLL